MNHARNEAENGEDDVEDKVKIESSSHPHADRRQEKGKEQSQDKDQHLLVWIVDVADDLRRWHRLAEMTESDVWNNKKMKPNVNRKELTRICN